MDVSEYLLTTDAFNNPTVIKNQHAIGVLLTRLLLLEPGTNPLHPDMGVGVGSKYRYILKDQIQQLNTLIQLQVETYLPIFQGANIELRLKTNGYLEIRILLDSVVYVYDTEDSDTPIQVSDI